MVYSFTTLTMMKNIKTNAKCHIYFHKEESFPKPHRLMVQKIPMFLKTQPTGFFWITLGFGLYWVFGFLRERTVGKLVG